MIGLIISLAFFGVLLDMVEIMASHPTGTQVLAAIEDAGEMLIMSVITWFVFRLNINEPQEPLS